MKPTLFLLAAGMGSRYGGLKQLDGLGPNGETIMDYSIYDAIEAGFGKIVWVIRKDFEEQFRISRSSSVSRFSQSMRVRSSASSVSRVLTLCQRVSQYLKAVRSLGEQTTLCLWVRTLSRSLSA